MEKRKKVFIGPSIFYKYNIFSRILVPNFLFLNIIAFTKQFDCCADNKKFCRANQVFLFNQLVRPTKHFHKGNKFVLFQKSSPEQSFLALLQFCRHILQTIWIL